MGERRQLRLELRHDCNSKYLDLKEEARTSSLQRFGFDFVVHLLFNDRENPI
jgi:hypothetical protein